MIPFNYSDYKISDKINLTVIDIEHLTGEINSILDDNFVFICEGNSGSDLPTVKRLVTNLYASKNDNWIMGATAEFFVHLYVGLCGFKQECLFLNLEEGSIKKGFDGYYSQDGIEWLMESKSGLIGNANVSHAAKVQLAMNDLEDKVTGNDKKRKKGVPNNPWRNAYSHANLYDIGTAEKIRKNIKSLSDDFTNGRFHSIDEFNTMPCGTVYLSGVWNPPNHQSVLNEIKVVSDRLKGRKIHAICVTHKSIDLFKSYIAQGA